MQEDKLIDQLSMIWEGWTEKPKTDEPWFQERLKHCSVCPHNSVNKENLTFKEKVAKTLFREPTCTACGCPISKKLTVKRSICGLKNLGQTPLWFPLEVEGGKELSNTSLEKENNGGYLIGKDSRGYTLDFGKTTEDKLTFSFILFAPIQYEFVTVRTSCSCTVPEVEQLGDGRYRFNVQLSTLSFNKGAISTRDLEVRFTNGLSIHVNLKVEKL